MIHPIRFLVTLLTAAAASPIAEPAVVNPASAFCAAVTAVVTKAKAQSTATAYCSSYLSIGVVTVTSNPTVTSPVIVKATITAGTNTQTVLSTVTVTQPAGDTVTVLPTGTCTVAQAQLVKRATVAKPACFSTYTAAPIISSACKCLSIPASTSTVVGAPVIARPTSTVTVTVDPTVVSFVTVTTQTPAATVTAASFRLRADDLTANPTNPVAGQKAYDYPLFAEQYTGVIISGSIPDPGSAFTLNPATCQLGLFRGGKLAYGNTADPVRFSTSTFADRSPLICRVAPVSQQLICDLGDGVPLVNNACEAQSTPGIWYTYTTPRDGCSPFIFRAFT
ncbi:hypothetical protein Q7P37_005498 [Cladosporium fusiforme]